MIMKKLLLILLLVLSLGLILLYWNESSYSPLQDKDFKKLFHNLDKSPNKVCDTDFIGTSFMSELFEIYLYDVESVSIDLSYPKFKGEWEKNEITEETIISKWTSCPLDSITYGLYKTTLTLENFEETDCFDSFNMELKNSKNYFSHVYFNELEQYLLLYCPDTEKLYYLRRKGF